MTAQELLEIYINVRNEEKQKGYLGVITNSHAMPGGIMIVGMNPSGQVDEVHDYSDCESDFWNPKHEMLGGKGKLYDRHCAYIDLFPIKEGRQNMFAVGNDTKNRYYGRLLSHTWDYIESMRPRLIIFTNTSKYYWGFEKNEWMGYEFEPVESPLEGVKKKWKLYKITGIKPTDVNRKATNTSLEGTYFLQYRQHRDMFGKTPPANKVLTFEDIKSIATFISIDWEKTLY